MRAFPDRCICRRPCVASSPRLPHVRCRSPRDVPARRGGGDVCRCPETESRMSPRVIVTARKNSEVSPAEAAGNSARFGVVRLFRPGPIRSRAGPGGCVPRRGWVPTVLAIRHNRCPCLRFPRATSDPGHSASSRSLATLRRLRRASPVIGLHFGASTSWRFRSVRHSSAACPRRSDACTWRSERDNARTDD